MSSAIIVDQRRGIVTTVTFTATRGFDVPLEAVPGSLYENHKISQQDEVWKGAAPKNSVADKNMGFLGLMEISRASGVSGVLCPATPKDETELSLQMPKLEICCTAHTNQATRRLVKSVNQGLTACQEPEKAADGMGGTYFFLNESGSKAAIFKPCDEEPLAPNNPKGFVGRSLGEPGFKPTVRVGEAALREVAAYLLDHDNFAKVPVSVLVRAKHPIFCYNSILSSAQGSSFDLLGLQQSNSAKDSALQKKFPMKLGSLQKFVNHLCDANEMGSSRFNVRDVQRIGILDIRLFNTDRHAGNILVRPMRDASLMTGVTEGAYELIPIDHGFCLPETVEAPYFEWLHWKQAMLPFGKEELEYIQALDVNADKELLRKELPMLRPQSLRVLEVTTTLLKMCAAAGLNLTEIGTICSRPSMGDEEPSELENLCMAAYEEAQERNILINVELEERSICMDDRVGSGSLLDANEDGSDKEEEILLEFNLELEGIFPDREQLSPGQASNSSSMTLSEPSSAFHVHATCSRLFDMALHGHSDHSGNALVLSPMAASAHVTDFHFWKEVKARNLARHSKKSAKAAARPVRTCSPEALNTVFQELGDAAWPLFMEVFRELVADGLATSKWRLCSKESIGVPLSCPRF